MFAKNGCEFFTSLSDYQITCIDIVYTCSTLLLLYACETEKESDENEEGEEKMHVTHELRKLCKTCRYNFATILFFCAFACQCVDNWRLSSLQYNSGAKFQKGLKSF